MKGRKLTYTSSYTIMILHIPSSVVFQEGTKEQIQLSHQLLNLLNIGIIVQHLLRLAP